MGFPKMHKIQKFHNPNDRKVRLDFQIMLDFIQFAKGYCIWFNGMQLQQTRSQVTNFWLKKLITLAQLCSGLSVIASLENTRKMSVYNAIHKNELKEINYKYADTNNMYKIQQCNSHLDNKTADVLSTNSKMNTRSANDSKLEISLYIKHKRTRCVHQLVFMIL